MTTPETRVETTHHKLQQEPESFAAPRMVQVAVVTLIIFALGIVWSTEIWLRRSKDLAPNGSAAAVELGKREIGIVDQVPFEQQNEPAELRAAKLRRLGSYGYVDKARGVVHVPIERGYEMAIEEQKGGKK